MTLHDDLPTHRFDEGTTEVATTPGTAAPAGMDGGAVRPSSASGRYVTGAEIGRGGMGRVVVGTDTRLGREVAIKEALPQGADLERFEREVRITARLEHPSIVPLYDVGVTADGRPFYVMRKVSGRPLERLIAERSAQGSGGRRGPAAERSGQHSRDPGRGRGPVAERLALLPHVLAAAHALGHAHRRGVIHRDVKPANILVGDLGETVMIDWGLAKVVGEDEAPPPPVDAAIVPSGEVATAVGTVFGTPGFMAPEQARGEAIDARSDVYALGATLYQVLAGEPPLQATFAEVIAGARDEHRADAALAALAALPLPPELVAIVVKAMQFAPAKRYPDGVALADDLNRFLAGRLVTAHRYTRAQRLRRLVRRYRAVVAVAAISTLVVVAGGTLAIRSIVLARDRARQAEQAAIAGQKAAELARDREADRADDAVILKARAELARDPTAAVATLAALRPQSRRWDQARPIAIEARLRGIAHIYREDAAPRTFELAPDPRFLLVAGSVSGKVSIIDLEHDRERELVACDGRCIAAWGEGGAVVWIAPAGGGLSAIEVATGAHRPAVLGEALDQLVADPAATYLAFASHGGRAGILDAAGVHELPALSHKVGEVQVSRDGSWAAFATERELVVVDRGGRELAREAGALLPATLVASASGRALAILADGGVVLQIAVDGGRASVQRITPPWRVFRIAYVNDLLYVNLRSALEMRPLQDLDNRGAELGQVWWSRDTWQGHTAIAADALLVRGPLTTRTLWPPVHDPILAIAARRDARYLAVHTRGLITTWDLGDMLPVPVASDVVRAWVFDDQTAIVSDFLAYDWIDLTTRARTPIALPSGFVKWQRSDPATGRQVLVLERSGESDLAVLARHGRSEVTPVDVPGLRGIDFAGPDLVAGTARGELVLVGDHAPPRVIHRFDAAVELVVGNGAWVAGLAASGALARFDGATGTLATVHPPFSVTYMMLTRAGELYLAAGRDLYRWRGRDLDHVTALPSPLTGIDDIPDRDSVVVSTQQGAVYAIDPGQPEAERTTRLFFRAAGTPRIDHAGRYLAVDTINGETTIFDLSRGTRWRMPSREQVNTISPSGRIALLLTGGQLSVIGLDAPDDPEELRAWVVQATNYTLDATGP